MDGVEIRLRLQPEPASGLHSGWQPLPVAVEHLPLFNGQTAAPILPAAVRLMLQHAALSQAHTGSLRRCRHCSDDSESVVQRRRGGLTLWDSLRLPVP